jgi:xanthine dehydrogenase accessory factor
MDIYSKIQEFIAAGKEAAVCTIIETSGSTPRKPGTKMVVTIEGKTIGSVGGGKLEQLVIKDAITCISAGKNELRTYDSGNGDSGHIYGEAKVFIEVLPKSRALYIFGAGHVGQALAAIAGNYGFNVSLIDPRTILLEKINIEGVKQINSEYIGAIEQLPFDEHTYIVVMTNTHESDEEVSYRITSKPHAYLGMIGSTKKVAQAKTSFIEKGMDTHKIEKIDMPIGMPMHCETPAEIAISILARLIDTKNA